MIGAEEDHHGRDILRSSSAAERDLRLGAGTIIEILECSLVHRCENHPGRHIVDRDAVRTELECHGASEIPDAALGYTVRTMIRRVAGFFVNRRDVDDAPALAAGNHPSRRFPATKERAMEIGSKDSIPLLP